MLTVIYAIYALIFLMNILFAFFIIYHLVAYSINSHFSHIMVVFFGIISAILILSNFFLFLSVDWKTILASVFSNNSNPF